MSSDAEAGPIRTCRHCEEEIEYYEGTGWVETAEGGHYDICNERPTAEDDIDFASLKHEPA